jgi:AhpD family alkylhydroperoxidase
MLPRINFYEAAPEGIEALAGLGRYTGNAGIEEPLLLLIKIRSSQINGCAYCIDMHTKDARAAGETEQRIYSLNAWRETPFFSERERAALEWTEALTLIAVDHAPDELFLRVRQYFSEPELVNLSLAIVTINAWNRLAIAFRSLPGSYQPAS